MKSVYDSTARTARWPQPPLPPPDPIPPLPDPISPLPPLPSPFPVAIPGVFDPTPHLPWRNLRGGCYLISLGSSSNLLSVADGTLRVECHSNGRTASGDLYQRQIIRMTLPGFPRRYQMILAPPPNPRAGIPIFPRSRYRQYLRVTQILERATATLSFTLGFELHNFDSSTRKWTATLDGPYSALMSWTTAPAAFPSGTDYLEGYVKNGSGVVVGRLTMGWVSPYLRRAVVEIDRVPQSEAPVNNGAGVDWRSIFDQVGWDVTVVQSDANVTEPSGEGWNDAECHQGMLTWRASADLDSVWRYHLLCVRRLDSTPRGVMYDAYGGDSNNIPREGAAISSHWIIPNAVNPNSSDPDARIDWDNCAGLRFGSATGPYFRTAVHEIGHAMMMFHPGITTGNHVMQVTPQIAANATPPVRFPDNIEWAFAVDDQRLLRHLPDVVVRPGTVVRFGTDVGASYSGVPISPMDVTAEIEDLEVQVSPHLDAVPLGAPVRVSFLLVNRGQEPVQVPSRMSLKSGHVSGVVFDPSGTARTFSSILRYLDEAEPLVLEQGQKLGDSLTLLRGPDGALFPAPGVHRVVVTLTWDGGGCLVRTSGETSLMVTPPVDEEHAMAALKVLSAPDALLTVVVGGDHMEDGLKAVQAAMNNPVLRPHFAYIEAKRLAQRFGKRKPNLKAVADLITDDTVMTPAEIKKGARLLQAEGTDSAPGRTLARTLKGKVNTPGMTEEVRAILDAL